MSSFGTYAPSFATTFYRGLQSTDCEFLSGFFVSKAMPSEVLPLLQPVGGAMALTAPQAGNEFAMNLQMAAKAHDASDQHGFMRAQVGMNLALSEFTESQLDSAAALLKKLEPVAVAKLFQTEERVVEEVRGILLRRTENEMAKGSGICFRVMLGAESKRLWATVDELLWIMSCHPGSWKYVARNFGASEISFFKGSVLKAIGCDPRGEGVIRSWRAAERNEVALRREWKNFQHPLGWHLHRFDRNRLVPALAVVLGAELLYSNAMLDEKDVADLKGWAEGHQVLNFPLQIAIIEPGEWWKTVSEVLDRLWKYAIIDQAARV